MIDILEDNDALRAPDWKGDAFEVTFTFHNGTSQTVSVSTEDMSCEEVAAYKNQLLGKQKLVLSIFEHGTHGQITVQGLTVRADDLVSFKIR